MYSLFVNSALISTSVAKGGLRQHEGPREYLSEINQSENDKYNRLHLYVEYNTI